ncbi:MAG: FapA family protein [Lachnospiraceae bacterium]|nr:FapA family protein [Lachnospiraceae bacterium]
MNGYFQLITKEKETDIRLIPPKDGGQPVDVAEVLDYLQEHGITYDAKTLGKAVEELKDEDIQVMLSPSMSFPERESYKMMVSEDRLQAVVRFYPPSPDGEKMTMQEFAKELVYRKIVCGLQVEAIRDFFANRRYCENIVIAVGVRPVQGTDAVITYHFETDPSARPTLLEDGSVDFFHLNNVCHCAAGDVLATLQPANPGMYGRTIYGERVRPRAVKRKHLHYGRNIELSEDMLTIRSKINGHVNLVGESVFVDDILEVKNVDTATGDLEFEGSVTINGNVNTNYSVKATGNVEIKGVVEGARVEAGGDIVIVRGANGMGKAELIAGRNVISKFLENVTVTAGDSVSTESILHSKVTAKNEINVDGKKGFITGGHVCAGKTITAKTLGSSMGGDTIIEVGTDPELKSHYHEQQKQFAKLSSEMKQLELVVDNIKKQMARGADMSKQQMRHVQEVMQKKNALQDILDKTSEELNRLENQVTEDNEASVVVRGEVYAGTKICIGDVSMVTKGGTKYCRFVKQRGDVKIAGI